MSPDVNPPAAGGRETFGRWMPVAALLARHAFELAGVPGGSAVVDVVVALVDVQGGGHAGLLSSIKDDTATVRAAPLNEALQCLDDAKRVGPEDPLWDNYIRRAEERLGQARQLADGRPAEIALVEFNLAMVFWVMGHAVNTRHHLEQSVRFAERTVNGYVNQARFSLDDRRPLNRRAPRPKEPGIMVGLGTAALFLATGGLALAGYVYARRPHEQKAINELKAFLDLYNVIHRAASSSTGGQTTYLFVADPVAGSKSATVSRLYER